MNTAKPIRIRETIIKCCYCKQEYDLAAAVRKAQHAVYCPYCHRQVGRV